MCLDSAGSSPSQMIATWLPRLARCRSMQFIDTFVIPSSNHLIETLPGSKDVFFTFVNGLIQSIRLPCAAQNASGVDADEAYILPYFAASACARRAQSVGTSWIKVSDFSVLTLEPPRRSVMRLFSADTIVRASAKRAHVRPQLWPDPFYLFRSTAGGWLTAFPSSRNCAFIFSICSLRWF